MEHTMKRTLALVLSILLVFSLLPFSALAEGEEEQPESGIIRTAGDYEFIKISNPTAGSGEPDGINTNDLTGCEANRLNSYAWAVASRGDYIYIGTNRTLFGSALNAVIENNVGSMALTREQIIDAIEFLSGGDMPVDLSEEDYIPQIIKVDVNNGCTEVIYEPATGYSDEGVLCYLDKNGQVVKAADVASETASFRSVVEFRGSLYFGSLGTNMISLVRIDEDDNAEVVYQTVGLINSLRANCRCGEGDEETICFGGFDTTYQPWREYRATHPEDTATMPIVIRYLDPATAGTDEEDWSGLIADFTDFGKYARAGVYVTGGGNVWDLCAYNGYIYLVLGYDAGWALFRGEKADESDPGRNDFGWKWTEIVGDDSIYGYPLGMNEELAELNAEYAAAYNGLNYGVNLRTAGLLESTATPYVYNGKMYLGTFDNATAVQSETVVKAIRKLNAMMTGSDPGPSLASIFGPIYQVLSHPQHIWVMDAEENIVAADEANELLEGTTNDYVWRFIEYQGRLYTGTFDASSAYTYFLNGPVSGLINSLQANGVVVSEAFQGLRDGSYRKELLADFNAAATKGVSLADLIALRDAVDNALAVVEAFLNDEADVDDLLAAMEQLQAARDAVYDNLNMERFAQLLVSVDFLLACFDVEGLRLWSAARALANRAQRGFDIYATEDGENWDIVVRDGIGDPYNYGARTFTICNDELYVGTANPYYGAQLWRIDAPHMHTLGEPEWRWLDYDCADILFRCTGCEYGVGYNADVTVEMITEPTCTEPGECVSHASIVVEDVLYEDDRSFQLPPLGHSFGRPIWGWEEDLSAASAIFFCETCGEMEEIEAEIRTRVIVPSNNNHPGLTLYIAAAAFEGKTYRSFRISVEAAEIHEFGEPEWVWDEENHSACAVFRCRDCELEMTIDASITEEFLTEPSCTEGGESLLTAVVEFEGTTYADVRTVETAPYGHACEEPEWAWAEDYSAASASFTCQRCGDHQCIEAEVSSLVLLAPNCVDDGMAIFSAEAEYEGKSYTDHQLGFSPALGHVWDEGVVTVQPTGTEEGERLCTCTRCGETKTEAIPVLENPFSDLEPGEYYYNAVLWAYYHQPCITAGEDSSHFGVGHTVTRGQAMTFLWAAAGKPAPTVTTHPFLDVGPDDYFRDPVLWAVNHDPRITAGVDDTHFGPEQTLSRGMMILFLYAAQGKPATELDPETENPFSDTEGCYWRDAAVWAYENGIDKGSDGAFHGEDDCPRELVVMWLYRVLEGKDLAE